MALTSFYSSISYSTRNLIWSCQRKTNWTPEQPTGIKSMPLYALTICNSSSFWSSLPWWDLLKQRKVPVPKLSTFYLGAKKVANLMSWLDIPTYRVSATSLTGKLLNKATTPKAQTVSHPLPVNSAFVSSRMTWNWRIMSTNCFKRKIVKLAALFNNETWNGHPLDFRG